MDAINQDIWLICVNMNQFSTLDFMKIDEQLKDW